MSAIEKRKHEYGKASVSKKKKKESLNYKQSLNFQSKFLFLY